MAKEVQEKEQLNRLQEAAEKTNGAAPEEIEQKASRDGEAKETKVSKVWFIPHAIAAVLIGAGLVYLDWKPLHNLALDQKLHRYLTGALAIVAVLAAMSALENYAISRIPSRVSRFNLKHILRLVVALALAFIVVSMLWAASKATAVSLGLGSLILGFALQTPILSLLGWIYILIRRPYRVGDRIELDEARGDVIDVSYLDTTLWEIGGRHLTTDHPSGRVIKFPNSKVLSTAVYNYSWPLFPYIWNEIKFHVAYESDLEFVATTMERIAAEELGESMMEKVKIFRDLLARTPVDQLQVRERPAVLFRVNDNTWLEAIVRYLVHPKEAGRVKTALTRRLLQALNKQPDKVLFPKSNSR